MRSALQRTALRPIQGIVNLSLDLTRLEAYPARLAPVAGFPPPRSGALGGSLCPGSFGPACESSLALRAVVSGGHAGAAAPDMPRNRLHGGLKAVGLPWRLAPAPGPFLVARRWVRGFPRLFTPLGGAEHRPGEAPRFRRSIAGEVVGDEHAGPPPPARQYLPQEARGGLPSAPRRAAAVPSSTWVSHGAPQGGPLPVAVANDLREGPFITGAGPAAGAGRGRARRERAGPCP